MSKWLFGCKCIGRYCLVRFSAARLSLSMSSNFICLSSASVRAVKQNIKSRRV